MYRFLLLYYIPPHLRNGNREGVFSWTANSLLRWIMIKFYPLHTHDKFTILVCRWMLLCQEYLGNTYWFTLTIHQTDSQPATTGNGKEMDGRSISISSLRLVPFPPQHTWAQRSGAHQELRCHLWIIEALDTIYVRGDSPLTRRPDTPHAEEVEATQFKSLIWSQWTGR